MTPARAVLLLTLAACGACVAGAPGSVGAVLGRDGESRALHVRKVPEGSAAARVGVAAGDEIVMIDGAWVKDLDADQIRQKLRGEPGTTVALTVVRGDEVRHVVVTRAALRKATAPAPREERIAE